jgi:sugar-specific transcriptional regulator TrmB
MDSKLLEEIGLTKGEAQVYLALLKIGSTKVGPLVAEAKISSSKIYEILDKLEQNGLAGHIFVGKTKH